MTFGLTTLNRLPGLFLLLALAGMTGSSHALAASFNLAGETVKFQPPGGYCFLDQSDERERPLFERMERLQQKAGNQLLAVFAICDELSSFSSIAISTSSSR
jgi:hypothetical protein